jgi:paraquat-inducible protein B
MPDSSSHYPQAHIQKEPLWSWTWLLPFTALVTGIWLITVHYLEKGPTITIAFESAAGIEEGRTHIRYKDVDVGKVTRIRLQKYTEWKETLALPDQAQTTSNAPHPAVPLNIDRQSKTRVLVEAQLEPFMSQYLGDDSRFWVVRPRISTSEVSGLSTLFSGFYIGMDPGNETGTRRRELYIGLEEPPKVTTATQGVEIILNTDKLGSINIGAPIYYRQLKVGEVVGYELSPSNNSVNIAVNIEEKYAAKIHSNTRFWNVSGITLEMTPNGGVSAHMESLISVLIGGIAFDTPDNEESHPLSGKASFSLYKDFKSAWEDSRSDRLNYVVYFEDSLFGLKKNAPVYHQGIIVGKVSDIHLQSIKQGEQQRTRTEVSMTLHGNKFKDNNNTNSETILQNLVHDGLRAQLKLLSLLTNTKGVSLIYEPINNSDEAIKLAQTSSAKPSVFPSTRAGQSILHFDPSELSQQVTQLVAEINQLIASKDIKRLITQSANAVEHLQTIIKQLEDKGLSTQVINTLKTVNNTLEDIQRVAKTANKELKTLAKNTNQAINSADETLNSANQALKSADETINTATQALKSADKTLNTADTALQTANKTLHTANKAINNTLGEDAALQYRLDVLIEDLSQAADAFSTLADTLQRKPNAVIFGK